jgi:hypothetical protein
MDLIILFFAIKLVKNLCQDLVWLARGEDPPSFRREQERRRLRAARGPVAGRGEARQFWVNAWDDAWESANERRQRRLDKRVREGSDNTRRVGDAESPRPRGAEPNVAPMDVADPLKPVTRSGEPGTSPPATSEPADGPAEPVYRDVTDQVYRLRGSPLDRAEAVERQRTWQIVKKHEAGYQRYAMRRRNGGSVPSAAQLAEDLGVSAAAAQDLHEEWADRYQREIPDNAEVLRGDAEDANYRRIREKSLAEWREHIALPEEEKQRLRDEVRARLDGAPLEDTDPDPARRFTSAFDAAVAAEEAGDTDRAQEHLVIAEEAATELGITTEEEMEEVLAACGSSSTQARPATTPAPITASSINGTENDMSASGETTGLQAALTYTQQMATSSGEGATSVETSLASLQAGEVGGAGLAHLAQAQELLTQAQAAFDAANAEFTNHMNVKEAYDANPDAGNKQFLTNN